MSELESVLSFKFSSEEKNHLKFFCSHGGAFPPNRANIFLDEGRAWEISSARADTIGWMRLGGLEFLALCGGAGSWNQ